MANYVNSNSISVYPSGYRGQGINYEAGVNSEKNLNSLASRLVYNQSYIVETVDDIDGVSGDITFVIKGYIFKTTKDAITGLFSSAEPGTIIYAHAKVINITTSVNSISSTYQTLIPYDANNVAVLDSGTDFKGVYFDTSSGEDNYALALYKRVGTSWKVVEESKLIFSSNQIQDRDSKKSIKEEMHVEDLTAEDLHSTSIDTDSLQVTGLTTDSSSGVKSVSRDASGNVVSTDLTLVKGTEDGTTATFNYVDTVAQSPTGQVSITTKTKAIQVSSNTQGRFTVGTDNLDLLNLGETGTPKFGSISIANLSTGVIIANSSGQLSSVSPESRSQGQVSFGDGISFTVTGISENDSPSFSNITDTGLTGGQVVVTNSSKKLISKDFTFSMASADSDDSSSTSFTYIKSWTRDADGDVTVATENTSISDGTSSSGQGTFTVNGNTVKAYGLSTISNPQFSSVRVNALRNSSGNFISLPTSTGTLATVSWDSSTKTLTIKTN